jgi:hypothetical protein
MPASIAKAAGGVSISGNENELTVGFNSTTKQVNLADSVGNKYTVATDTSVGASGDRGQRVGVLALTGLAIHNGTGGVIAWTNPETVAIIIDRVVLDITTVSTGASTIDVGVTETSATTTSDTLLDGIDGNAATGVFDSMNAALDSGANAKAQKLAAAKWVTIDEKTGDTTGLVGNLYVYYHIV